MVPCLFSAVGRAYAGSVTTRKWAHPEAL